MAPRVSCQCHAARSSATTARIRASTPANRIHTPEAAAAGAGAAAGGASAAGGSPSAGIGGGAGGSGVAVSFIARTVATKQALCNHVEMRLERAGDAFVATLGD